MPVPFHQTTANRLGFLVIGILATTLRALAQTSQPAATPESPPEPPLVAEASTGLEWTVTYSPPPQAAATNAAGNPVFLKSVKASKAGNFRREISTWSDGSQSEDWQVDDVLIHREPTWAPGFLLAKKTRDRPRKKRTPLPAGKNSDVAISAIKSDGNDDFRMAWISSNYFKKTTTLAGKTCHLYEAPDAVVLNVETLSETTRAQANDPEVPLYIREIIQRQVAREKESPSTLTRAWIDAKTRLPLVVETGGVSRQFKYSAGPTSLSLPPAYEKEYSVFKQLYPDR